MYQVLSKSEYKITFLPLSFLYLIVRKFEDPNGGDVNYVAFIQAIDEYTGQVMETEKER